MNKEDTMAENKIVAKTEAQDLQKQEHTEERTIAGRFWGLQYFQTWYPPSSSKSFDNNSFGFI